MPTLLRLKSQVFAAEEEKMESEKVQRGYEGTKPSGRLAGGHRGMVGCGVSTLPFFLPLLFRRMREALIQDANFLLIDVNMRGHAENRVYIFRSMCLQDVQAHFLPIGCTRSD